MLLAPNASFAGEIKNTIVDSVQLNVQGAAVVSEKLAGSYSVSGSNISATALGRVKADGSIDYGTYTINNDGQAFSFSESARAIDTAVTSQTVSNGQIASPNLYGHATTQLGGDASTLAGSLSATGVPTITAGGPGTTATAQRSVELSVFK